MPKEQGGSLFTPKELEKRLKDYRLRREQRNLRFPGKKQ